MFIPPPIPVPRAPALAAGGQRAAGEAARAHPLAGKVIGIDPGHNGSNWADPSFINRLVWNGRTMESCDTTGTSTNAGFSEAQFNWDVATVLRADLRGEGARVVLTRHNNHSVGPCVNKRSYIINRAHANVAIDIHADGGPSWGRGFAILLPVKDGPNNRVIGRSDRFARDLRARFLTTGMPLSNYDGTAGFQARSDLAGLNLTRVPKVLIETGNMRNATDASMLTSPSWRHLAARAMAQALTKYLTGRL